MNASLPLEGIKILDLSRVLALPFATMILSDLGAEVIKVERPALGDETRHWGPPFLGSESAYFLCVNRNKKSITVDIKKKEGQKIIHDLASICDVFVENYKVGELKKYSLDHENIKKINPSIVYCSLTGYGQNGPKSHLPGYDFIMQGESGLMSITGSLKGQPMKVGVAILDIVSGLYAAVAILASLLKRQKVNQSEYIDLALYDCAVASLANVASNYLVGGKIPKRYGNAHPNIVPYQTFKAKDKYFNLAVGNDEQFQKLTELLSEKSLKQEKFRKNADRVRNRKELIKILQSIFVTKNASYWVELFQLHNIPAGHINNLKEVFEDDQLFARNMINAIKHPFGTLNFVGSPLKLMNSSIKKPQNSPLLGQDTMGVLKNLLHYKKTDIEYLKNQNII
ncbi:L-carnitine dehydratase/bile acid-inducible protein F [Desulfurella amilsii]|uniref:L-carnitine dehydratase/bile acid-inducible protein F n=1 Tax=Desulfurella amilsii TaxID=1562698 RepID=A0A1X4XY45_9BACT|nr:CaiB/BaiF CoA-transferase family protein [Desulfurella amilsii]OSS42448.1 L-carnitine dehydratase/bile acid-inducible protein F [Desulfurella amilsii]